MFNRIRKKKWKMSQRRQRKNRVKKKKNDKWISFSSTSIRYKVSHFLMDSDIFWKLNTKNSKKREKKPKPPFFFFPLLFSLWYIDHVEFHFVSIRRLCVIFHLPTSKPVSFGFYFTKIVVGWCLRIAATLSRHISFYCFHFWVEKIPLSWPSLAHAYNTTAQRKWAKATTATTKSETIMCIYKNYIQIPAVNE